ncbi:ATP-dependent endonuclease [Exiguobacterium sp. s166]|uniref:ATP-dependent nuclease n=1 Tax=Exiguobacterium sp. s166 TaxID=2751204 RepID=UPI001BE5B6BF|nr:AAA family ATPase [Exiguobacterium sp. s166]
MINKLKIINYKSFQNFELDLNSDLNIIIGDNEAGKSTLLETINLALTGQLNNRLLQNELSPYLFNINSVKTYLEQLIINSKAELPSIKIELYFDNPNNIYSELKGTNNLLRTDAPGVSISIEFDSTYQSEYEIYIQDVRTIKTLPIEYYKIVWRSFAGNSLTSRGIPARSTLIDTSTSKYKNGADIYLHKILNDSLEPSQRTELAVHYRKLKETFSENQSIATINESLNEKKGDITDKNLNVSVDISSKTNWDKIITAYLDDVPFDYIGKGEQNAIKMKLALESNTDLEAVVLIEEPENHLSLSNLNKLLNIIKTRNENKQLIITTHSSFILNKLDIGKMILLSSDKVTTSFNDLENETREFFMRLPGYDTLRLVLSRKVILVEGPSEDLIVQRAYKDLYDKLPLENGVDIFCIDGLSFKRFIEISANLQKEITIITDNDGDIEQNINNKYEEYLSNNLVKLCYSLDENLKTLEPNIIDANKSNLSVLKEILGHSDYEDDRLITYMLNNKTKCALKIFETDKTIKMPRYILNAIEE